MPLLRAFVKKFVFRHIYLINHSRFLYFDLFRFLMTFVSTAIRKESHGGHACMCACAHTPSDCMELLCFVAGVQLQFIFELPARLHKCMEMNAYPQAVR